MEAKLFRSLCSNNLPLSHAYLRNSLDDAVVGVDALVGTVQTLEPAVLDDLQRELEPTAHLLEFAEHTVRDVRDH